MEDPLKQYPVWSNFVYFFAGAYALIYALVSKIKLVDKLMFFVFGWVIIGAGIASVIYHKTTPSWTNDFETLHNDTYIKNAKIDTGFALSAIIYAFLFLFYRLYVYYESNPFVVRHIPLIYDSNWWIAIFFITMASIFFCIATNHDHIATTKCKDDNTCFDANIDVYDVFHSNWHIFAAVGAFFWINVLENSFSWK